LDPTSPATALANTALPTISHPLAALTESIPAPAVCPVILVAPGESPLVRNQPQRPLSGNKYRAIKKLVEAFPNRVNKPELPVDPVYLRRVRDDDGGAWPSVLDFPPPKTRIGYGLKP
jgi:hypothetical protein